MRTIRVLCLAVLCAVLILSASPAHAQCPMGAVPQPNNLHPNDVVMIGDAFPTPHTLQSPGVTWDTTQFASGTKSFVHPNAPTANGTQEILVYQMQHQRVFAGDVLVAYVLIDSCNPTQQILITYSIQGLGQRRFYWGTNVLGATATSMGALPAAGAWARLEIPLETLGNDAAGRSIDAIIWNHAGGRVWYDHVGRKTVYHCPTIAAAPTDFHPNDTVFYDDAFPSSQVWGQPVWDTTQKASGTQSFYVTSIPSTGPWEVNTQGFSHLINANDELFVYAKIDPCNPPSQLYFHYQTSGGSRHPYWGENTLNFSDGVNMGPIPAQLLSGGWMRMTITEDALGNVEGKNLLGLAFGSVGGKTWFDRPGKKAPYSCSATAAPPPSFHAQEVAIFDDAFPAGTAIYGAQNWDTSQKASGTQSFWNDSPTATGAYETTVQNFPVLRILSNDEYVVYARIDPCKPPSQLYIVYMTSAGWKRAYWGANTANFSDAIAMGPLTSQMLGGEWVRLAITEDQLGNIEGGKISGLSFGVVGGKAWFDRPGRKSVYDCSAIAAAPNDFHANDVVLWDDAFPAGTAIYGTTTWDTTQKASGTQSFWKETTNNDPTEIVVQNFPVVDIAANDEFGVHVRLEPCNPPTQVYIVYMTSAGWKKAYWGANTANFADAIAMGPLTPQMMSGQWVRLKVTENDLGNLEGAKLGGLSFGVHNGKAWFDRPARRTAVSCSAAAVPSSFDPNELVLFDDAIPAGANITGPQIWRTDFKVSGTQSLFNDMISGQQSDINVNGLPLREVKPGDQFVAYVRSDPCAAAPQQIYITLQLTGGWRTVYWGSNVANVTGVQMSPTLPAGIATGDWVRLVIPEDTWPDLEGKFFGGINFGNRGGRLWWDRPGIVVVPCSVGSPSAATPPETDGVWIDDAFPTTHVVDAPGATWDTTQKASGNASWRHPNPDLYGSNPVFAHSFTPMFPLSANDKLLIYMLVDPCEPPDQIVVTWAAKTIGWRHASWGANIVNLGTPPLNMGAIPAGGVWHRIEIPAASLGFANQQIGGVAVNAYGGRAWFDRAGRVCPATAPASTPGPDATETIWIDDAPPAGAASVGSGTFNSSFAASGSQALLLSSNSAVSHEFTGATATITPAAGEALVTYVLFNECNIPKELVLSFHTTTGQWKRVFWGTDTLYGNGRNSTLGFFRMGDVPSGNTWHRLAVNAARLGLEGVTIDGFRIEMVDGYGWFDRIGKSTTPQCATPYPQADSSVFWDEVLVSGDDAPPAGATVSANWTWDTGEKASGTSSHTDGFAFGVHQHSFSGANPVSFATKDWISLWVLMDKCDPAREIMVGANGKYLYWGENLIPVAAGETKTQLWWDASLPEPGVWKRLWFPASEFGIGGSALTNFTFAAYDGQVWFDRLARIPAWAEITSVTLDKAPTISVGQSITITATATGSFYPLEFDYWIRDVATRQWTRLQDWSTANSYTWTPAQAGTFQLWVDVRNAGSQWADGEWGEFVTVTVNP